MRAVLIAAAASLAAIAVPAAPAEAQDRFGTGFSAATGAHFDKRDGAHRFDRDRFDRRRFDRGRFDRDRRDRRRDRRFDDTIVIGDFGWNDSWALYNNRTFEPDSYNDWWHERPWRSYPRWVREGQSCDRLWWSGGGWRC